MNDFLGRPLRVGQEVAFVDFISKGTRVGLGRDTVLAIHDKKVRLSRQQPGTTRWAGRLMDPTKCIGL